MNADCQRSACKKCVAPDCAECTATFTTSAPGGCKIQPAPGLIGGGGGSSGGSAGSGGGGTAVAPGGPYHVISIPFTADNFTSPVEGVGVQDFAFSVGIGTPAGLDAKELLWVATGPDGTTSNGNISALDLGAGTFKLGSISPPPEIGQALAIKVSEELTSIPRAHIVLANPFGIAEADVTPTAVKVLAQIQLPNPADISLSPNFTIQPTSPAQLRIPTRPCSSPTCSRQSSPSWATPQCPSRSAAT